MFKGVTFNFTQPFCDCDVLDYGYGLSSMGGSPAFAFQCRGCATTVMMPLVKLNGGFEFDWKPPGVRVGGKAGGETEKTAEDSPPENEVVERDNVIYGPWAGSDRPEDLTNEVTDE